MLKELLDLARTTSKHVTELILAQEDTAIRFFEEGKRQGQVLDGTLRRDATAPLRDTTAP